ncbi:hypothetical protein G9A89_009890 [Geosiphon pyriformis]|nr:hypothetical protein G9A89_009890 [Geosiphon pyriformis]
MGGKKRDIKFDITNGEMSDTPANLHLSEAILDSPTFRANVRHFEEQVDYFEKWLDGLWKSLKNYVDEMIKFNEASNLLAQRSLPFHVEDSMIDGDFSLPAIKTFSDALQSSLTLKKKLVSDMDENLLQPISQFIKTDLREFKEARRNYDQSLERYENILSRYTSQSKTKEASSLREDAFQLYEVRKSYIRVSLEYSLKIIQFRTSADHLLLEQFLAGTHAQFDFHESSNEVYQKLENLLDSLKCWLGESKKATDFQLPRLQKLREKLEEEAISMAKPRRNLTKYKDHASSNLSSSNTTDQPSSQDISSKPTQDPNKEGYLFIRIIAGKPARFVWSRKFFILREGTFWWSSVGQGKQRSIVEESERIGVLLCEIRVDQTQDRRYCFEIVCGAKQTTYLLQAETETELKEWMAVFESAKRHAFTNTIDFSSSAAAAVAKTENELLNGEENGSQKEPNHIEGDSNNSFVEVNPTDIKEMPSPLLIPTAPTSATLMRKRSGSVLSSISFSGNSTPKSPLNHSSNIPNSSLQNENSSASNPATSQANFWGTIQWGLMPAVNLLMNTVNALEGDAGNIAGKEKGAGKKSSLTFSKDGRSGSGSLHVGSGSDRTISNYSQDLLLHNIELHCWFKPEIDEMEFVLDVFQCAWAKENILFKGRAYLTQKKLYFYSDVMSLLHKFSVPWHDLKRVAQTSTNLQQTLEFIMHGPEKYVLKTFLESGHLFCTKVQLVWKSVVNDKAMSLQLLFDTLWGVEINATNNKLVDEKRPVRLLLEKPGKENVEKQDELSLAPVVNKKNSNNEIRHEEGRPAEESKPLTQIDTKSSDNNQQDTQQVSKTSNVSKKQKKLVADAEDEFPQHIPHPSAPVNCGCSDHLERQEAVLEFHVSAKKLFDMLFDEKSTFWERLHKKKGNRLQHLGSWVTDNSNAEGERKREIKFVMTVNNPMAKVKETDCIETQICQKRGEYLCYVVLIQTKALQLPYNDAFLPLVKYCITFVSTTTCKMTINIGVRWFKSPMVKAIIRKHAMAGLAETVVDVVTILKADIAHCNKLIQSVAAPARPHAHTIHRRFHAHHKSRSFRHTSGEESTSMSTLVSSSVHSEVKVEPVVTSIPSSQSKDTSNILDILVRLLMTFADSFSILSKSSKIMGIILVLSIFMNFYLWFSSGNISIEKAGLRRGRGFSKDDVWNRAVYLRDLEEGIINNTMQLPKMIHASSYNQFLDTRLDYPPYPWLMRSHRVVSDEISVARERIAVLRYDLLLTFQLLNSVDKRLFESEYMNWLMDERAKCGQARWMILKDSNLKNMKSKKLYEKDEKDHHKKDGGVGRADESMEERKLVEAYCQDVDTHLGMFGTL